MATLSAVRGNPFLKTWTEVQVKHNNGMDEADMKSALISRAEHLACLVMTIPSSSVPFLRVFSEKHIVTPYFPAVGGCGGGVIHGNILIVGSTKGPDTRPTSSATGVRQCSVLSAQVPFHNIVPFPDGANGAVSSVGSHPGRLHQS